MKSKNKIVLLTEALCIASVAVVMVLMSSCGNRTPKTLGKVSDVSSNQSCVHNAPKSVCFICDPSLRDPKRLWCIEHNRYEDRDFECHPQTQEKSRLYCKEHGLYEDECIFCHPELVSSQNTKNADGEKSSGSAPRCKEHNLPEQECGICHPDLLASLKPGEGLKIRFESALSADKAGIITALPDSSIVNSGVSFPARTGFNENASAIVVARYTGVITSVKVDLGTTVKMGQMLATISSPELAQTIAEFRSIESETRVKKSEYLREKDLFEKGVSSRQQLDDAEAMFNRARNTSEAQRERLKNAGIAANNLSALLEQNGVSSEFAVRAPVSGTITQRSASVGQSVSPETQIMTIVNLTTMWIHVSVPSSAGSKLMPGDMLRIAFDENSVYSAKVNWVSPEIDMASGMIQIRAVLKNPKESLKSGLFCRAFLISKTNGQILTIPIDALANIEGIDVIFAKVEPDLYEVRRVSIDGIVDGKALVSMGLKPGENVVVNGTFVVKSEFLKSKLGAGCVDD